MIIHREGYPIILIALITLVSWGFVAPLTGPVFAFLSIAIAIGGFIFIVQFFRNPRRRIPEASDALIYAPADGKVVVIEEVFDGEYFKDQCIQISIFMSPLNVHVNRVPVNGALKYKQYHPGKYLVAWHPKSSTENERYTVAIAAAKGDLLIRQIAGAVARRIKNYLDLDEEVVQGQELGFIKFGSRVDVLLPLETSIRVNIGDKVKGNRTVLAQW